MPRSSRPPATQSTTLAVPVPEPAAEKPDLPAKNRLLDMPSLWTKDQSGSRVPGFGQAYLGVPV